MDVGGSIGYGEVVERMKKCCVEVLGGMYDLGILDSAWRHGVQARGWENLLRHRTPKHNLGLQYYTLL